MTPNTVSSLLVLALLAASGCSSQDTRTTSRSGQVMAPSPGPVAPGPAAPNPPGPVGPPASPAPNPPGPLPSPAPAAPHPPAPNPPGPATPVRTPGFLVIGAPIHHSVERGGKATFVVSLRSVNGFRGRVTMFARILPDNELWRGSRWSPQSVTLAPDASATATLTIVTSSATPIGTHPITLEGRAEEIEEHATIMLTVR